MDENIEQADLDEPGAAPHMSEDEVAEDVVVQPADGTDSATAAALVKAAEDKGLPVGVVKVVDGGFSAPQEVVDAADLPEGSEQVEDDEDATVNTEVGHPETGDETGDDNGLVPLEDKPQPVSRETAKAAPGKTAPARRATPAKKAPAKKAAAKKATR